MPETQIIYNVPHEIAIGLNLATYFYLTGISAGSFVVSVIAIIGGKTEFKPIGKIGAVVAPLTLFVAPIFLIIDLEQPFRFWHLFLYINVTSPISYGTFLLMSYPINGLIYAWAIFTGKEKLSRILGIIGIPLAICTHGYTGFILALGKGRPLWSTALMPTLFIVSAMVSGIALVIFIAAIRNKFVFKDKPEEQSKDRNLIFSLGKIMGAVIIFDLFLLSNDVLVLFTSKSEELYVANMLFSGRFTVMFLGLEVLVGSLIPLFLVYYPRTAKNLNILIIASVMVMMGIYVMRVVVVYAGQMTPLH